MDVSLVVSCAGVARRASVRIGRIDLERMLIDMIRVRMMQVSIMQVIGVTAMGNRYVAAARAMLMSVILMFGAAGHGRSHMTPACGDQLIKFERLSQQFTPRVMKTHCRVGRAALR